MTSRTMSWGRKVPTASKGVVAEVGHLDLHPLVTQGHGEQIGDAVLVVDDEDARAGVDMVVGPPIRRS